MPSPLSLSDLFEELCDAPAKVVNDRLRDVPTDLAVGVRAMLRADESNDVLEPSHVHWSIAAAMPLMVDDTPALPAIVGGYRIIRPLGEGGMGRVLEAEQVSPRRRVALKALRASGPAALTAALEEAQALAQVRDPRIPHVIEVGSDEGIAFVVMELVHGVSLRTWAKGRSVEAILRMMASVARGVATAHGVGVLHRDLKPANLLVGPTDQPYIVDFGLAGESAALSRPAGTLPYLPPEALNSAPPTTAGDVYALGVTLYELLTGRRPHPNAQLPTFASERLARRHPVSPPSSLGHGAADTDAIIARCLGPFEQRYRDAAELADDLEAYLAHRPTSARPVGVARRLRMWAVRNRGPLAVGGLSAGVAVGVMLGVAGTMALQQQQQGRAQEAQASTRLLAVEMRLAPTYATGDFELAESVLQSFVEEPSMRTTAATSDAWLHHHEHLVAAGQRSKAWPFLARAFLSADEPQRRDIRSAIARQLHAEWRWPSLLRTLDQEVTEETKHLRGSTLVALRRFDEALEHVSADKAALLRSIQGARRFSYRPVWAHPITFDGSSALVFLEQDAGNLAVVRLDPHLTLAGTFPLPEMNFQHANPLMVGRDNPRLLGFDEGTTAPLRMWQLGDERLEDKGSLPVEGSFLGGMGLPMANGQPYGLFLGTLYPGRTLWHTDPVSQEATPVEVAGGRSDVHGVQPIDLDRDGVDELMVTTGLWEGHELRFLHWEAGALRLGQRLRFQGLPRAVLVERGKDRVLLVAASPTLGTATATGSPSRYPSGLHVFRIDDDGALQPLHHYAQYNQGVGRVLAADIDGDGKQEAVVHLTGAADHMALVSFDDDLKPTVSLVAGLVPVVAANVDDDRADELFVRMVDDDHHLWLLGLENGEELPPWSPDLKETRRTAPSQGDAITELLALGLDVEIADALQLATGTPITERSSELALAGQLMEQRGRLRDAVDLYDAALAASGPDPALRSARQRAARAAHLPGPADTKLAFTKTLPESIHIRRGAALHHQPGQGLEIDAVATDGVLFDMEVDVEGQGIGLALELNVRSLEPGMQLLVELVDIHNEALLGLEVHGWGGDLRTDRMTLCRGQGTQEVRSYGTLRAGAHEPSLLYLRTDLRRGEQLCEARRDGHHRALETWPAPKDEAGRYRLTVRVRGERDEHAGSQLQATLVGLSLWGAHPSHQKEPDSMNRHWSLGQLEEALSLADQPQARAPLLLALGESGAAIDALRHSDPAQTSTRQLLIGGLKRDAGAWLPLVHTLFPDALPQLYLAAWGHALASHREPFVIATTEHPYVDSFQPDGSEELSKMLYARAVMVKQHGQLHRSRRLLLRILPSAQPSLATNIRLQLAQIAWVDGDHEAAVSWCEKASAADTMQQVADLVLDDPTIARACEGAAP